MAILDRLIAAFDEYTVPYAIVGGFAVALHGAPRGTIDIDCIIRHTSADFEACEKAILSIGLVPRLPVTAKEVFQFRTEYIERRNLIAWSFVNPKNPIEVVDIIITDDLNDVSSVAKNYGLKRIRVLAVADLIAMKRRSARPQDLEDVKMLERLHGQV